MGIFIYSSPPIIVLRFYSDFLIWRQFWLNMMFHLCAGEVITLLCSFLELLSVKVAYNSCLPGLPRALVCQAWLELLSSKFAQLYMQVRIGLLYFRAQLFKANDVVNWWFVKIYIEWYANILKFFAEKNVSSFCSAKATHIFSAKNIRIFYIESAKTVNEMTFKELIKLTMLWTTGPRFLISSSFGASSGVCFMVAAFPEYLHIFLPAALICPDCLELLPVKFT